MSEIFWREDKPITARNLDDIYVKHHQHNSSRYEHGADGRIMGKEDVAREIDAHNQKRGLVHGIPENETIASREYVEARISEVAGGGGGSGISEEEVLAIRSSNVYKSGIEARQTLPETDLFMGRIFYLLKQQAPPE